MLRMFFKSKYSKPLKFIYSKSWQALLSSMDKISPELATRILHYKVTKKTLNLKNPSTFNEKLQWLKLHEKNDFASLCADKYELHEYVKKHGDTKILNKIIAVYNKTSEIKWETLPNKFALKCTHGCAYNVVTNNKQELRKDAVLKLLDGWLNEKFGKKHLEPHYDKIKPRIILEEYIETKEGLLPPDYKIYCFNGIAKLVLVCSERDQALKLDFFDLDWKRLNIGHKKNESLKEIRRPVCFDEMIKHAEQLSKPFKFVRVDFYDKDGKPILGELTFTPAANMATYYSDYGNKYLGDLLEI